jgi:hypothetical protein
MLRQALGMLLFFTGLVATAVSGVAIAMGESPALWLIAILGVVATGLGIRLGLVSPNDEQGRRDALIGGLSFLLLGAVALASRTWLGWVPLGLTSPTTPDLGLVAVEHAVGELAAVVATVLVAVTVAFLPKGFVQRWHTPITVATGAVGLGLVVFSYVR